MQKTTKLNLRKRSFIFYKDWLDIVLGLQEQDQLAAVMALCDFAMTGQRPEDIPDNIDAILDHAQERVQKDYQKFLDYMEKLTLNKSKQ